MKQTKPKDNECYKGWERSRQIVDSSKSSYSAVGKVDWVLEHKHKLPRNLKAKVSYFLSIVIVKHCDIAILVRHRTGE